MPLFFAIFLRAFIDISSVKVSFPRVVFLLTQVDIYDESNLRYCPLSFCNYQILLDPVVQPQE